MESQYRQKKVQMHQQVPCFKRSFPTQGKLNRHYQRTHDKVRCSKCNMVFTSPSTLTRHMYTHAELHYLCKCRKSYHFPAELRVHKLTHRRICIAICSHPGCNKSYFSQADLSKHAKTHDNVKWNCSLCMYVTNDERLLKSHHWKHEQTVKYHCEKCGKGFVYHTQWKW